MRAEWIVSLINDRRRCLCRRLVDYRFGRRDATVQIVAFHLRRGRLLVRLLAQRVDLEPRAGRKHQQFKRTGIEQSLRTRSTVGIHQGGNLVFQHQGENPAFSAGRRSKLLQKAGIQVRNRRARRQPITDRPTNRRSVFVERKVLYRIAMGEAASLPSRGMAALHHKKRHSLRIARTGVEQSAQNFLLRTAQMDFCNRARQIRRTRLCRRIMAVSILGRSFGCDLIHDPADNLDT